MGVEFNGPTGSSGDIPYQGRRPLGRGENAGPLQPVTHAGIVRESIRISHLKDSFPIQAGADEIVHDLFSTAIESGHLDIEDRVGRTNFRVVPVEGDIYETLVTVNTYGEAYAISDPPPGEKVIADIGLLVDSKTNEFQGYVSIRLKATDAATVVQSVDEIRPAPDAERQELLRAEVTRWGIEASLTEEYLIDPAGESTFSGELDEARGQKLHNALRDIRE